MTQVVSKVTPSVRVPPLQNGDHLTRAEFERRYDATPGLKRAELIDGRVYMSPPLSNPDHGTPHLTLGVILGTYYLATPGTSGSDCGSVRIDSANMPQPDLFLMIEGRCGGQADIDEKGYLTAAPELIAEISASSASYDLHEKLELYRRSGVREYIVWRTLDGQIDYFVLHEGHYKPMIAKDGVFRSEAFPGLWINTAAILANKPSQVMADIQKGLASAEHTAFVESLKAKASK